MAGLQEREIVARALHSRRYQLDAKDTDSMFAWYAENPIGTDRSRIAIYRAYQDADAVIAALAASRPAQVQEEALRTIAKQKTTDEWRSEYGEEFSGDFKAGYNTIIKIARDAIQASSSADTAGKAADPQCQRPPGEDTSGKGAEVASRSAETNPQPVAWREQTFGPDKGWYYDEKPWSKDSQPLYATPPRPALSREEIARIIHGDDEDWEDLKQAATSHGPRQKYRDQIAEIYRKADAILSAQSQGGAS